MSFSQSLDNSIRLVVRLDDVGASSKRYEVYSRFQQRLGRLGAPADWLFLKYLPGIRAWGPYREMSADVWRRLAELLERHDARLTVGVTAAWADDERRVTPYYEKFPEAAAVLKEACRRGLVEIANHGLTHCVVEGNRFKPRLFSGNRTYHREFSPLVPAETQGEHLRRAQEILQGYFETEVVTFIPPGTNFMNSTLHAAEGVGLRFVSYDVSGVGAVIPVSLLRRRARQAASRMEIDDAKWLPMPFLRQVALEDCATTGCRMLSLHDRDIVLKGLGWFDKTLGQNPYDAFQFARDAGQAVEQAIPNAGDA